MFIGLGDDPERGDGPGRLLAVDPSAASRAAGPGPVDITGSGLVWAAGGKAFRRTISTVAVHDGLVYAPTLSGFLRCFEEATGKEVWSYDLFSSVWGSPFVVDGKVFVGDEDGDIVVLKEGRTAEVLSKNNLGSSVYGTPVAAHGVLFVASRTKLFAIAGK